jgi:hypothetical protein
VIDDRRDHALEAEKDSDLNGDEHNGKDNSDDRGDQSNPVMKKIARCERENHRVKKRSEKRNTQGIGIVGKPWNVMVLNPLNLNMNIIRGRYCRVAGFACPAGRGAADDVDFRDVAIEGDPTPLYYRVLRQIGIRYTPHGPRPAHASRLLENREPNGIEAAGIGLPSPVFKYAGPG